MNLFYYPFCFCNAIYLKRIERWIQFKANYEKEEKEKELEEDKELLLAVQESLKQEREEGNKREEEMLSLNKG